MDFVLRCNSPKCRAQLGVQAVVTTCSHIFCVRCAESLGLSNVSTKDRLCPACGTNLPNPDDAVAADLDPAEDYKTSVLSGLSPSLIMECAGRGLAFYSYQAGQEILYQEYLAKTLTEKHDSLSSQMDELIHDANSEISKLRKRLSTITIDNDGLRAANNDLKGAYNDKAKAHARVQKQYDGLKKQSLQLDVQSAAVDAVEETLNSIGSRIMDPRQQESHRQHLSPSQGNRYDLRSSGSGSRDETRRVQPIFGHTWVGQDGQNEPSTPSQHRTRLPVPSPQANRSANIQRSHDTRAPRGNAARQPLGPLNASNYDNVGNGRYGMSSGIKAGRYPAGR